MESSLTPRQHCRLTICIELVELTNSDKAPRLSISIVIWILSSDSDTDSDTDTDTDTICQLNQFNTNSEAAMLFKV